MDDHPIEELPAEEPYDPPVAKAIEGPDPDSVMPAISSF
jgi:hypothetical protein